MKRIDDRTVELTDDERAVSEEHDQLLDDGFSTLEATSLILGRDYRGGRLSADLRPVAYEVRTRLLKVVKTSDIDSILTPEFVAWLSE